MTDPRPTLQEILAGLQAEQLIGPADRVQHYLEHQADRQPWYIRVMVGLGAWLASLLLIGFVASFSFALDTGYTLVGLALIIGAILVRRQSGNDFVVQCTLACSLAGQALCAYGVAETVGHEQYEVFLGLTMVTAALLFFLYPDRIHRVIMVCLGTGSMTGLLYAWEWNALVPLVGPSFAALLALLFARRPQLAGSPYAGLVRPLMDGLVLSAFAVLLLSAVYLLPELGLESRFYPRPWISTLLFGLLLIFLAAPMVQALSAAGRPAVRLSLYGLLAVIILCSWAAPGLLLGLIVTLLGASYGNRAYASAGVVFGMVFLGAFFYGIEISMLGKSLTLVATGTALLISRWIILGLQSGGGPRGAGHV